MSSDTTEYDLAVLGGGPAGLVSALLMRRHGYSVVLLNKPSNGAEKVGESMPAATNRLLQKLALPALTHDTHDPISGAMCYWAGFLEQQDGLAYIQGCDWRLNRTLFEKMLFEQAQAEGVDFINEKLTHVCREEHHWVLETDATQSITSEFIIDASGRSAILPRLLSVGKDKGPPLIAVWASVGIDTSTYETLTQQTLIESQANGWWYAARLPQQRIMAIFHTDAEYAADLRKQPHLWQQQMANTALLSKQLPIDSFTNIVPKAANARDTNLKSVYGDGWAACGDAALSFDPLSSQGIYNALASAAMLYKALINEDRESSLREYQLRLNQVAATYQQKRQQYYRQAYNEYQTEFWKHQLRE